MRDGSAGGDAHCRRGSWGTSAPDSSAPSREDPTEPRRRPTCASHPRARTGTRGQHGAVNPRGMSEASAGQAGRPDGGQDAEVWRARGCF